MAWLFNLYVLIGVAVLVFAVMVVSIVWSLHFSKCLEISEEDVKKIYKYSCVCFGTKITKEEAEELKKLIDMID